MVPRDPEAVLPGALMDGGGANSGALARQANRARRGERQAEMRDFGEVLQDIDQGKVTLEAAKQLRRVVAAVTATGIRAR